MLDILIKNTMIVDGTGKLSFRGNVGIKDGKINLNNINESARRIIDGSKLHTAPGFIDFHSHGDMVLGQDYAMICKLSQGITTEIGGQCGSSMFPVDPNKMELYKTLLSVGTEVYPEDMKNWTSFQRYLEYAQNVPIATNMKFFVGHGCLRLATMGYDGRTPTKNELEHMKRLLEEAMKNGAMGMSTGLIYTPSAYAKTEEIIELAKIVAKYNGVYATHMRNESSGVIASVKEAIEIGRQARVAVVISHHKVCGKRNWGLAKDTLELVEAAISEGVKITLDQYPYTASMTHLNACIPPWYFTEGIPAMAEKLKSSEIRAKLKDEIENPDTDFDNYSLSCGGFSGVMISSCPVTKEAEGLYVTEYAKKIGKDPFEAFCDLMIKNKGVGNGIYHCMWEDDLCRIIQNPNVVVGTDGVCRSREEKAHPRAFGSFPHAINYFHKERNIMSLEEIIRKMTSLPAERGMIENKGAIKNGYDADIVIFDYENLKDRASFTDSNQLTEGIEVVIVNGKIVYENQKLTGESSGKILLHNRK